MNIRIFIVWNWNLIDFLLAQSYLQIYEYQLLYLQRLPMIPSSSYIYEYQLLFFQRQPMIPSSCYIYEYQLLFFQRRPVSQSRSSTGADLDQLNAERSIKSHPNDNVKRRTLLMKKTDNSGWGFTLQVIWTLIFPPNGRGGLGWVMVCKET
jgi:hypothetical protein